MNPLDHNQFLSGGLVLMILGGLLVSLRQVPLKIYRFLERFFILRIEILDEEEAYTWMQVWLADRLKDTLSISVTTKPVLVTDRVESGKPEVFFIPAVGTYFFWYKNRFVTLYRTRTDNTTSNLATDLKGALRTKESFILRIFSRNKVLAKELIDECISKALPDDGKIDVRVCSYYGYWTLGTRISSRPLDSVILDGSAAEDIYADMKDFLGNADWYRRVGIPYRRIYAFYGEPGAGKSTLVKALASEFKMNIYLIMLSDPNMNDSRFSELLYRMNSRNILLLEDIDCALPGRKAKKDEKKMTLSGLLNGIDGVATPEGHIICMTTNKDLKDLDPALTRAGRMDYKLYFSNATFSQAKRLYERFFPGNDGSNFASLIPEKTYSMADLQNYLMLYKKNPELALDNIGDLSKMKIVSNVKI